MDSVVVGCFVGVGKIPYANEEFKQNDWFTLEGIHENNGKIHGVNDEAEEKQYRRLTLLKIC